MNSVWRATCYALVLCCVSTMSFATQPADPRLEACIVKAANYRGIQPALLKAIAIQESGLKLGAMNRNKNGSIDHGPFQINSGWLPQLRKRGITEAQLYDPCVSAFVAAWILKQEIDRHGATWRAVGAYNSPSEENRRRYAKYVQQHYLRLIGKNP